MSKFKPTKSQQLFLDSDNKNTLVSASAGSGKTSTMINKLVGLIKNGVKVKNLLVVTYTNSAGNEMKQKLFNALVEEMQNQSVGNVDFISQQLDDMVNCDIGTLHSICKKIIINYFYVVGQDPSFSLLNEQQSEYMYDNAMTQVFNDYTVQNNDEFYSLYTLFNKKRNLSNLKNVVKVLHNYLLSKVDALSWKEYVLNECCDKNSRAENYIVKYFIEQLQGLKKELSIILDRCKEYFEYYVDYVSDRINFVNLVEKSTNYDEFINNASFYEFVKKPRVYASKLSPDQLELSESADLVVSEFNETVKNIKKICVKMTADDYNNYKQIVEKLFNLVDVVDNEYKNAKKRSNVLDFSDLEHITLEILKNDKVVKVLKEKYEYIFVDEYQDINQVQEKIITTIARDNNLYMIGDVKQSIYAFRLSSPEIFIEKFNRFQIDTDKNGLINLNENFRSEENILEFANLVFDSLITTDTIGIDYKGNSRLEVGDKTRPFKKCVDMSILTNEEMTEGQVIAEQVGKLVSEGFDYKDIAILLRSKGELVGDIYGELKKYNIPCEATYKTNLFKNSEVLVIYYLLKLVNNSHNDIAMATVLKSKFVGLSDDELGEIRLVDKELHFYECAYEYVDNGTNEHIVNGLKNLFGLLKEIRFLMNSKSIMEVMDWLFIKYDIFNYYLSFSDGSEKISNINELLRIMSNEEFKYDLSKCVDYLDSIKNDGEVTLTLSGAGNCVRIMTIHSSKGLEYPAVILGGMGKKFVLNKNTDDIIINDKLGVGVRIFDVKSRTQKDSSVKLACKINNKKNEIDEEIRLLYVALTRAKNRLCIVGEYDTKNLSRNVNKNIYTSQNYFDLIFKAIPKGYIHFFENKVDNFVVCDGEKCEFSVQFICGVDSEKVLESRPYIFDATDNKLNLKLSKYFDYYYPHRINNNIALKNSVSQVLREEQDYEKQVDSIVLNSDFNDYSLRLGTAYHSIMQNLNYSENKAEIHNIIESVKTADLPYNDVNENKVVKAVENISKLITPSSKILKETQFIMKVNYGEIAKGDNDEDVLIQGVIDLAIVDNDTAIIVDFKTNRTQNEKFLIDHYAMQLNMYARAFEKAYGLKVKKKLLYSFEMGKFIEV